MTYWKEYSKYYSGWDEQPDAEVLEAALYAIYNALQGEITEDVINYCRAECLAALTHVEVKDV